MTTTQQAATTGNHSELVRADEALRITGLTSDAFYKMVSMGIIKRYQPAPELRSFYYRSELVAMTTPPAAGTNDDKSARPATESYPRDARREGARGGVSTRRQPGQ